MGVEPRLLYWDGRAGRFFPEDRLPNLLIAGVPKAATTSLFDYLAQHPAICPSRAKEPRYFSELAKPEGLLEPLEEYRRFFDWKWERYGVEATPTYCLGGERMMGVIERVLDHPRAIIILRDPTDRFVSAYFFQKARGPQFEIHSLEEFVSAVEPDVPWRAIEHRHRTPTQAFQIGCYGDFLPLWLDEFGDRLRLLYFDDLIRDPAGVVADLCRWLDIDDEVAATFDYSARNTATKARSRLLARTVFRAKRYLARFLPRGSNLRAQLRAIYRRLNSQPLDRKTVDPATRHRLVEMYREPNRRTASMLSARGYELPPWLVEA